LADGEATLLSAAVDEAAPSVAVIKAVKAARPVAPSQTLLSVVVGETTK